MAWWDRPLRRRRLPARTAAVQPIGQDWSRIVSRTQQPWQQRSRFFTENLGLIRFANGLTSQTAARCDLRVEKLVDPVRREWEPADGEAQVTDILETYQGPDSDSPSDLVARHVWHYQGVGEALDVDTLVATPTGFARMGDLVVGDSVLGGDGEPCSVLAATEVMEDRPCFEVVLRNGARVVADANHLWLTTQLSARVAQRQDRADPTTRRGRAQQANARKRWAGAVTEPSVVTTEAMRETLRVGDAANHAIRLAVVEGDPSFVPPVDPYLLGYWLGDGTSVAALFTVHTDDQPHLRGEVERAGYEWRPQADPYLVRAAGGFHTALRLAGLLGNKHIPSGYLRAGLETRWALLQGLIDSDGHVDKRGRVEFANFNKALLWQVAELASSLGLRVSVAERRLSFPSAGQPVARMPRKAERIRPASGGAARNYVVAVEPVKSRPVRCIQVDSPDHTFLVTDRFVETHNCYMIVDVDDRGELTWSIRSTQAVQFRSGIAVVMDLPGGSVRDGSARELPVEQVRRLWVPDDEWTLRAKSPMRAVLPDCERYWSLARRIRREAESVLTNGILFTPEYAHEYPAARTPGERPPSRLDNDYYTIAQAAFTDDDSVQAIAPLSMHYGPRDIQRDPAAPQFIYPGKDLDGNGIAYRGEAVETIARGLDLPMTLVTEGPGGGNHWSAWLVDEKFFTTHLGPTMDRVCHTDLSVGFFRPVLAELARQGRWNGDPNLYRVGYDPAPVIVHPDRAQASITLYGNGLLKGAIVCEANGFEGSDMPDPAELAQILETMRAIKGPAVPGAVALGAQQPGDNLLAAGPGRRELPPAPAMASLAPYPSEVTDWLD